LTDSLVAVVCSIGMAISSVSFWPFPAIRISFFTSFDDTRGVVYFGRCAGINLMLPTELYSCLQLH
jgi:hypothetical protein